MIVKSFIGKHIDLSKIVAISDAYFINRMGSGGYFVGFHIDCQLLDKPLNYTRVFEYDEYTHDDGTKVKMIDGTYSDTYPFIYGDGQDKILAVARLQEQIDDLVEQWKSIQ